MTIIKSDGPSNETPPRRSITRRLLRFVVRSIALPYLIICAIFGMIQRQLMYPARVITAAEVTSMLEGQVHIRPLEVTTADRLQLHGLLWEMTGTEQVESQLQAASQLIESTDDSRTSRPVVLYFPGNGGCRFDRLTICERFSDLGCNVVLFDYRGYGENRGRPSEKALITDARVIWDHLTQQMQIPNSRIVLYGESLGGGVAMQLAADVSRANTPPAGLVVSSTFSSMTDAACYHYPFLPVRLLLMDRYESQSHIAQITCPIVMVHGTDDTIVPLSLGKRLFVQAASESRTGLAKQFIEAPGAGHNDIPIEILCGALEPLIRSLAAAQ